MWCPVFKLYIVSGFVWRRRKKKVPLSHSWACGVPGLSCGTLGTARPKPRPVHAWTRAHTHKEKKPSVGCGGAHRHRRVAVKCMPPPPSGHQRRDKHHPLVPGRLLRQSAALPWHQRRRQPKRLTQKGRKKKMWGQFPISHLAHLGSDIKKARSEHSFIGVGVGVPRAPEGASPGPSFGATEK